MIFNEYLNKYEMHDCVIDKITVTNDTIIFYFNSGVYTLYDSDKESSKTSSCQMSIVVELYNEKIEQLIEINSIYQGTIKEIEIDEFCDIISNFKFDVDNNYFSRFNNCILIEGYSQKIKYQFKIERISKINFNLD